MNRLEIANNISTNIERERIKLGMSQAQFAKVQGTDGLDGANHARDRNGHETFAADDRSGALSDRR